MHPAYRCASSVPFSTKFGSSTKQTRFGSLPAPLRLVLLQLFAGAFLPIFSANRCAMTEDLNRFVESIRELDESLAAIESLPRLIPTIRRAIPAQKLCTSKAISQMMPGRPI